MGAAAEHGASADGAQAMHEDTLALRMNAHLDRMDQLPPDQLQAFLPEHRRRVQSMLDMRHEMM